MSSRAVTGCWRRAVAILIAVLSLTLSGFFVQSAAAAPAARSLAGNASVTGAGTPPLVLANWGWGGGCWRCGGFVGFNHPPFFGRPFFFHRPFFFRDRFFFHRPFFARDRFFFHRRFFGRPFNDRFGFGP